MLAKAIGRSIDCSVRRVQFTPDLLPSDITGVSIWNSETRDFEFKPGGIFANIVVGDEINRASPKTQSALLESMEERQVSVDGTTYLLDAPFMVVATQNPIEMEGTYPLPEAQRDRFLARLQMGYPTPNAELDMLDSHGSSDPLSRLTPVTDAATIRDLIRTVAGIYVAPAVKHYLVTMVGATRTSRDLRLGASPRASLQLLRAVRAYAALQGRDYVTPDDVQALAVPVLAHRVLLSAEAQLSAPQRGGRHRPRPRRGPGARPRPGPLSAARGERGATRLDGPDRPRPVAGRDRPGGPARRDGQRSARRHARRACCCSPCPWSRSSSSCGRGCGCRRNVPWSRPRSPSAPRCTAASPSATTRCCRRPCWSSRTRCRPSSVSRPASWSTGPPRTGSARSSTRCSGAPAATTAPGR